MWNPGGLPAALDAALASPLRPAIILVDTWWSPERALYDDDEVWAVSNGNLMF